MKRRCCDPNNKRYALYGGRGITVCNEWASDYMVFRDWAMASGYADDLTIDRKNNDLGYCPENCRWSTSKEQENNMSRNRVINYLGENHTMSEWSELLNIDYNSMGYRLRKGLTMQQTVQDLTENNRVS
jgi:hypothetical protein